MAAADAAPAVSLLDIVKAAMASNDRHSGILLAGGLAFFTALSLAPLFVVALNVLEKVLGRAVAAGQFAERLAPLVGVGAANAIQEAVGRGLAPGQGETAAIIAFIVAIFGAGGLFLQVRASLDVVFDEPRPVGPRGLLGDVVQAAAALFAVALALVAASLGWSLITAWTPDGSGLGTGGLEGVLTAGLYGGLVTLAYRYLVQGRVPWAAAWRGAVVAGLVSLAATLGIALYIGLGFATSAYGAAASFFVLLLWLWLLGVGFVVGAEAARAWEELRLGVVRAS